MGDFRKLEVWQLAKDLAVYIYKLTKKGEFVNDYDLRGQIRKAAVSIPINISEGDESGSNRQSIRYFNISKGSSAEIQTQTIIAYEVKYFSKENHDYIISQCKIISKKLSKLIQHREKNLKKIITINPIPQTSNPKPQTSNPKPKTPNPKPKTQNPKP